MSWLVAAQYLGLVRRLVILAAPHFGLAQYNMWRLRVSSLVQICCFWYILLFQARTHFGHGYTLHVGVTFAGNAQGFLVRSLLLTCVHAPFKAPDSCFFAPCHDIMLA